MKYSIKADFISHGYGNKVANKVDFLLNGIICTPGIFIFNNNSIKIHSDDFDYLEGKIEITKEKDIIVDFYLNNRNNERSHFQYKDGKIRYIVSDRYGLYIIKGNVSDKEFTISYYDQNAKSYIESTYNSEKNGEDILLKRPRKTFKSEGIFPDYTYNIKLDDNVISSYIFSSTWINDCTSFMEGESYNITDSKTKKIGGKKKKH